MTGITPQQEHELSGLVKEMAPGVGVSFEYVPMFDSLVTRIELRVGSSRTTTEEAIRASEGRAVGMSLMRDLAELQKEAVRQIGLEAYVREREVAVLEIAKERLTRFVTEALSMNPTLAEGVVDDLVNDIRNDLGAP